MDSPPRPRQRVGHYGARRNGRHISPSASQARQVLQEQKRMGQRAPTPGDWLDDEPSVTGQFAGKLALSVRSQTADAPEERHVIASRD
jgi:hypothetical protein